MSTAAIDEEPLFRGFLWGYLRDLGWKEKWILIFQAFLFWTIHINYWNKFPFIILLPFLGLLLGILAWRSRSIATSMAAHAGYNTLGFMELFLRR
jgi:hypothetical protein